MSEESTEIAQKSLPEVNRLWQKVKERTQHALQCGALRSIPTEYQFLEQGEMRFLVRQLANLDRKEKARQEQALKTASSGRDFNPFLPYEVDLFVSDLSETHVCLLNKYNVVEHHLLMITRAFEEQENWLNLQDFQAMWTCLAEIEGLAFYNGGAGAGASQRHKHLQLVPFPLNPDGSALPIAPIIAALGWEAEIATVPDWPFRHAIARFDPSLATSPQRAAEAALDLYQRLLGAVGVPRQGERQTGAYNLLATREWMLVVPRSRDSFEGVSVNSLGFSGALLVRNAQQMQWLKEIGPLRLLQNVGYELPS